LRIIDEKGKIFGLINYLDLIVLLVVLLLAGKFFILDNEEKRRELLQAHGREVLVTYNVNGIKDVSIKTVKEGDIFRDVETGNTLGEVVKIEVSNHQMQTTDRDGRVIYSDVPGRYDIMLTLKGKANETDKDIKVSNVEMQIGRTMLIESKMNRFMAVIYGIE